MMVMDTALLCRCCGSEALVNFSHCLQHGWPQCCKTTMSLVKTKASIGEAVGDAFAVVDEALRAEGR